MGCSWSNTCPEEQAPAVKDVSTGFHLFEFHWTTAGYTSALWILLTLALIGLAIGIYFWRRRNIRNKKKKIAKIAQGWGPTGPWQSLRPLPGLPPASVASPTYVEPFSAPSTVLTIENEPNRAVSNGNGSRSGQPSLSMPLSAIQALLTSVGRSNVSQTAPAFTPAAL